MFHVKHWVSQFKKLIRVQRISYLPKRFALGLTNGTRQRNPRLIDLLIEENRAMTQTFRQLELIASNTLKTAYFGSTIASTQLFIGRPGFRKHQEPVLLQKRRSIFYDGRQLTNCTGANHIKRIPTRSSERLKAIMHARDSLKA